MPLPDVEARVFRAVNRVLEPAIRSGSGSLECLPAGLIVLEARGRRSGRRLRTPLAATRVGDHFLVSTFRGGRSQWIRNLRANPEARCWVGGKARKVSATVFAAGASAERAGSLPLALAAALNTLLPLTRVGWVFVVLAPARRARSTLARSTARAVRARSA
jgi:deazaflavin-dependent oxidoreductase (nitroreductase family)